MAVDKKISQLTSLAQGDVDAALDVLPIVDTSANETKKITVTALVSAGATAGVSGAVLTNGTINSTTIGATTPSTGAFTTLSASSTVSGTGFSTYLASPPAIGSTAANTGAFTTLTTSSTVTLNGGTANGVLYLNGSKVATSGSALTFDGTATVTLGGSGADATLKHGATNGRLILSGDSAGTSAITITGSTYATANAIRYDGTTHTWSNTTGTGYMLLNSTGLGIGTASPSVKLDVVGTTTSALMLRSSSGALSGFNLYNDSVTDIAYLMNYYNGSMVFGVNNAEKMRLTSTGLGIGTTSPAVKLDVSGSAGAVAATIRAINTGTTSSDYAIYQLKQGSGSTWQMFTGANSDTLTFGRSGVGDYLYLNNSGNLGLGVTPSAANLGKALQITNASFVGYSNNAYVGANWYYGSGDKYIANGFASLYAQDSSVHKWYTAPSGTAGNAITFTQAMTLDANGDLLLGTTATPGARIRVKASNTTGSSVYNYINCTNEIDSDFQIRVSGTASTDKRAVIGTTTNTALAFITNDTERARITAGGDFLVGQTTNALADTGHILDNDGLAYHITNGLTCLTVNRKTSDGTLVDFLQDGTSEGTISVSGNTVSYNAFAGSHWSQLQDGSKPDILRGTVMESINELCVWPDENNERLPKAKISNTAGSKKVYGVFMAWDNDWTATNDMYVTAVGAFICRVNGGVTVQEGDLLESNGDGTARVQADDIIRSSTIGKVTSTVKTHQYDDGSYCVPTVLYCG